MPLVSTVSLQRKNMPGKKLAAYLANHHHRRHLHRAPVWVLLVVSMLVIMWKSITLTTIFFLAGLPPAVLWPIGRGYMFALIHKYVLVVHCCAFRRAIKLDHDMNAACLWDGDAIRMACLNHVNALFMYSIHWQIELFLYMFFSDVRKLLGYLKHIITQIKFKLKPKLCMVHS